MPKRGENIYKRKDGRWEGRVRKPEPSETGGKYKYIYGRTYKEVKEKMEVYKKEPFRKTCLHVWNMREAVEAWLKYGKADWKPTTYRTYRQIAEKYIVPFLGNMKIDRITAHTLDHFRRQINSGNGRYLSNNYQFYICSLVRRILMYTRERYNCDISLPVLPVFQNKKGRIELPGEKTLAALENYLLENIEEDTCVGIIIALYTGIRIGELCALTWEDIDWEEGILQVKKICKESGRRTTWRTERELSCWIPRRQIPCALSRSLRPYPVCSRHKREKQDLLFQEERMPGQIPARCNTVLKNFTEMRRRIF